jgi:hypothetical protein
MDRAGPHRRLAIAMPVLSLALLILALANVLDDGSDVVQWFPQVALAVSVLWALRAMLQAGRLIDSRGVPHAGLFAVGASVLGWAAIRFGASAPESSTLVAVGVGCMAGAATLFAGAERRSDRPAMLGGRLLLSVGALVLGAALLGGVTVDVLSGVAGHPAHVLGLALLGLAFVLLAIAEARMLVRLVGYAIDRERLG